MTDPALQELDVRPAGCLEPAIGERVLAHLDLLAQDDPSLPADVVAHAAACAACAAEVDDARAALGELPEATVSAIVTGAPVAPTLTVVVSCVYCHDGLARPEAVYCASCLAPHHAGCFEQHGRCAVRGCEDRRFVRPVDAQPPVRRRRWPWGLSLVAVSVGAAALVAERRAGVVEAPPPLERGAPTPRVDADPVVARVDDAPIRRSELAHACALVPGFFDLPEGVDRQRARLDALDRLIDEAAVLQAGAGDALTDDARRRADEALARHPLLARSAGYDSLREAGITVEGLRARLLAREVADAVVRREVPRGQDVPLAEVHRYYQEHLSEFWSGGEVRFRELVLQPDRRDAARPTPLGEAYRLDAAVAAALDDVRAIGFEAAAARWSMDSMAGAEQLLVASELDRVLLAPLPAALTALRPGQVSRPVQVYTGSVHVLQLVARTDPVTRPLAQVEDQIRARLRDERWALRRREWVRARRAAARVWLGDLDSNGGER